LEVVSHELIRNRLVPSESLVKGTCSIVSSGQPVLRFIAKLGQVGIANERPVIVTFDTLDAGSNARIQPRKLLLRLVVAL
jgi:hypothetical protein